MGRPLGKTQLGILRTLQEPRRHGEWFAGCGWVWGTVGATTRLLESLERRGLVSVTEATFMPYPVRTGPPRTRLVWTITDEGRAVDCA